MSSSFGNNFKITIFGESHSDGVGVVIDNVPAGIKFDLNEIEEFMQRRAPGRNSLSTQRKEPDKLRIISGILDGVSCGSPIAVVIENTDVRSRDYEKMRNIPRPGHSDYPAAIKHNNANDIRGGGHFSARLTAPLCFAGAIAKQLLAKKGVTVAAHIYSVADVYDTPFKDVSLDTKLIGDIASKELAVIDDSIAEKIANKILDTKNSGDSIGGVVECCVLGMPVGIGEPIFGGIENKIASAIFSVPAVKGVEFGAGFEVANLRGSENNDEFFIQNGAVLTKTNNHGGILGGLSSGMPIIVRAALKPTPSIAKLQKSIDLSTMSDTELKIEGRHDPCVVPRGVVAIEAAVAIAVADYFNFGG